MLFRGDVGSHSMFSPKVDASQQRPFSSRPPLPPRKKDAVLGSIDYVALSGGRAIPSPFAAHTSPFLSRGFAASSPPSSDPSPEWKEAREKRRGAVNPEPSLTVAQRAVAIKDATVAAGRVVVAFLASVPARLRRIAAMTPEERRAALAGAWVATKEVAHHFWVGSKLLWTDVKVSSRLTMKILNGTELSRREKRQLTRTAADLFRLVPMIVILVIPFLEFALPVLLKVFPNMLPSTFEDKLKKEEELKKRLSAKLEMARFLQDTVSEMAEDIVNQRGRNQASAAELVAFINKVRAGQPVANAEILRFAPLFNDELTLDNLDRVHLISICRFVGLQPFGTDAFLRSRIRSHIRKLKEDDREIQAEGLAELSDPELREACRARAMRAPYGPLAREFMERQLRDWLDLSLGHALPSSLLLMSRAMTIGQDVGGAGQKDKIFGGLVDTIQTLPDEVVDTVESDAAAKAGSGGAGTSDRAQRSAQMEAKLELINQEEEAIREEEAERKERQAALTSEGAVTAAAGATAGGPGGHTSAAASAAASPVSSGHPEESAPSGVEATARAMVRAAAINVVSSMTRSPPAAPSAPSAGKAAELGISEEELQHEQAARRDRRIRDVIRALAALTSPSSLTAEKEGFVELVKAEVDRINKDVVARGSSQLLFSGGLQVERPENKDAPTPASSGLQVLTSRVDALLSNLQQEIETADQKLQGKLRLLDLDGDGRISRAELHSALDLMQGKLTEDETQLLLERLGVSSGASTSADGSIDVNELLRIAREDLGDAAEK